MPTYQYRCTECGDELEAVQKFTDEPLSVCPVCNGQLRKLFSAVGVVFKGSGFYKTDSRSSSKPTTAKKDGAATGETSSSSGDSSGDSSGSSGSSSGKDGSGSSASTSGESTTSKSSGGSKSSTGDGSKVA
ncbi:MAG TPA: FmdB family zinc ribbon protein [Mycobacteriales bacterium]|jgi:putative FmdB family regulatory protein|nr:FmdB family zinc ribbon protein [Mycobacteriales bacterium]